MQPIAELDYQNALIVNGDHQHPAEGKRGSSQLGVAIAGWSQLILPDVYDFSKPFYDFGYFVAESLSNLLDAVICILYYVV